MDLPQQIRENPANAMSHVSIFAGKADTIIDYSTQTVPLIKAFNDMGVSFTAELRAGFNHSFPGFDGISHQMINGDAVRDLGVYEFRRQSLPAVTRAGNSGPVTPGNGGTDLYNLDIEWSVPWNNFAAPIVDTNNRYEVSLKSTTSTQNATITPRRTDNFDIEPGATYAWENYSESGTLIQSGNVTANSKGVVSVPGFSIRAGGGSRLVMVRTAAAAVAIPEAVILAAAVLATLKFETAILSSRVRTRRTTLSSPSLVRRQRSSSTAIPRHIPARCSTRSLSAPSLATMSSR